ncbi:Prephenate dehydrogenase [uncultured archaeon]|nr:Prephenate dehydrogenase [uncultured archaeon]
MGCGKMGSWISRELAKSGNKVAVFDRHEEKALGLAEAGCAPLAKINDAKGFKPEILVNAVSLGNTISAFNEAMPHIGEECILCDVASIKDGLEEFYAKAGLPFLSMHPMFGPTFASMNTPKGENAIIIKGSDKKASVFFREFFAERGVNVSDYTFNEHDGMMAYSLTTPFFSSLVFASCINATVVPGTTFGRHLAIAKGLLGEDDSLICEILFNRHSPRQIDRINSRMEHLKHIIMARDTEEAKKFLARLRENIK